MTLYLEKILSVFLEFIRIRSQKNSHNGLLLNNYLDHSFSRMVHL